MSAESGLARLVRRGALPAFALVGLSVVVAHCRIRAGSVALGVEATGYRELVNRALQGKLEWSARDSVPVTGGAHAAGEAEAVDRDEGGPLELNLELGALSPAERAFVLHSFVLDDLEYPERFARGESAHPRLRAGFRRRPLPFSEAARWRGRLLFRRGAREVALRSRQGREVYLHAPRDLAQGLPHAESVPLGAPASESDAVRSGPSFKWELGGKTAFTLHALPGPAGALTVVLERPRETAGTLILNGITLPADELQRAFEPGDWLVLRSRVPAAEEIFFLDQGLSGVISEFRRGREGFERTFAPASGLEPLARSVAGVYDGLLSLLEEANARNATSRARPGGGGPLDGELRKLRARDLRLTLDAALQAPAQALLERQIRARMPASGWHVDTRLGTLPREPPRAALSVIELGRGELLAAASFPGEEDLERHLEALQAHVGRSAHRRCSRRLIDYLQLQHERRRERLLANHVFDAHQVGSTIKPLLAAAFALHWTPAQGGSDPLDMTVACAGASGAEWQPGQPVPLVPGTDVPMAVYDDVPHGTTNFRQFLARSCNSFMFRLAAQALRATPGFSAADCDGRLEHVLRRDPTTHPATRDEARALTPFGRFAWLAGAFLRDPESRGVGERHHAWWRPASDEMFKAVGALGCSEFEAQSLAAVSPAWVNLDVTGISRCHPNLSSLLKGGGTNRWSNADLGIAYARLVSGRVLEGRVVMDENGAAPAPSPAPAAPVFDASDCRISLACADPARFERVRGEVLAGMGQGFFATGTSRGVHATVADVVARLARASGRPWGAYAKTGSSERPLELVARVDDDLHPSRRPGSRVGADVREANFTLLLVECAADDGGARAATLACERLPPLGPGARGYALHLWTDGVPGIALGGDAAVFYNSPAGRALLDRLVRAVEAGA